MLAPQEERTFFITTNCYRQEALFRSQQRAALLLDVLQESRRKGRFLLHEFVIMPSHIHAILTPAPDVSLEKAVQFIKGGFSFRIKKELGNRWEVWQQSFTEHRVKDAADYERHREYIHLNPVRAGIVQVAAEYPYSSARIAMDECPPWLKPSILSTVTRP